MTADFATQSLVCISLRFCVILERPRADPSSSKAILETDEEVTAVIPNHAVVCIHARMDRRSSLAFGQVAATLVIALR